MSLTPTQQTAVKARGNVLVAAGAGTGKTSVLVERCLDCLLTGQTPVSIDELLIVTFTEAAAAEMRQRIREQLMQKARDPAAQIRWREQLALFETAHIGTLHSFCLQLVRQHFYQLGLDPQMAVLADEEAQLLANDTLDELIQRHYSGNDQAAVAVQQLIEVHGRGWDKAVRALVLKLHHYSQTQPRPAKWIADQLAHYSLPEPMVWRAWLQELTADFPRQWLVTLENESDSNALAAQCAAVLQKWKAEPSSASFLAELLEIQRNCPHRRRTSWLGPLEKFFSEVEFVHSLLQSPEGVEPLNQDWNWVRQHMCTLLELSRDFSAAFSEAKREAGMVDFHDLEQHCLRLLWDDASGQPSAIAREWRNKLRFVFVDEYQDINAAQDKIIEALSREQPNGNRFLVGDVKQSIYRFRLANPEIFQGYFDRWSQADGQVIGLVDNFRSRERVLSFVNSAFELLMSRDLGGVDYARGAALQFGAATERAEASAAADQASAVELHLLLKAKVGREELAEGGESMAEIAELLDAEKEARMVSLRLKELQGRHQIRDTVTGQLRPVEWRDIAVLLRSPAKKAESYAKEFARLNIPAEVSRTGFYGSLEVSDLISTLQVLDNPLQDLPVLAVLHSPLVGLSARELAEIRLAVPRARFWQGLTRWIQDTTNTRNDGDKLQCSEQLEAGSTAAPDGGAYAKVARFLERFGRWRNEARQGSLSRCVEMILAETHYDIWLQTRPGGAQRNANVQRLLNVTQQFDKFQRHSLYRFLRFVEAQQAAETEPEIASVAAENAVRLMSIHQSKGLEFPVVVVADLAKPFNLADLRAEIILDEQYGLCPQVKPPHTGKRYPSLAHWLSSRRQLRGLLGEELRLLYVAVTRARDLLILTGSISEKKWSSSWCTRNAGVAEPRLAARSYTDWLGLWFSRHANPPEPAIRSGQTELLYWFVHDWTNLVTGPQLSDKTTPSESVDNIQSDEWRGLVQRLAWQYPFLEATRFPAKTSVSALRRQTAAEADEAAVAYFDPQRLHRSKPGGQGGSGSIDAADIGTAHHVFLQFVSLAQTGSTAALAAEAERLVVQARLTPEEAKALNLENLAQFWAADLGRRIRNGAAQVHRELPFTARFAPAELPGGLASQLKTGASSEFVLVQGVADLVVIAPEEIWLVDFKTDEFPPEDLAARVTRYEPQLRMYALALSRIYSRPITESWLHFLSLRQSVRIQGMPAADKNLKVSVTR